MARQQLSGRLILNQISVDDGVTWKTIVCEKDSTITGTSASTTEKTKCEDFTVTSNDPTKVSGSGVAVGDFEATEMSYMDMQVLRDSLTEVLFRRMNSAYSGILAGELTYAKFSAFITEVSETSTTVDSVQFNWAVISTGTVDWDSAS